MISGIGSNALNFSNVLPQDLKESLSVTSSFQASYLLALYLLLPSFLNVTAD